MSTPDRGIPSRSDCRNRCLLMDLRTLWLQTLHNGFRELDTPVPANLESELDPSHAWLRVQEPIGHWPIGLEGRVSLPEKATAAAIAPAAAQGDWRRAVAVAFQSGRVTVFDYATGSPIRGDHEALRLLEQLR